MNVTALVSESSSTPLRFSKDQTNKNKTLPLSDCFKCPAHTNTSFYQLAWLTSTSSNLKENGHPMPPPPPHHNTLLFSRNDRSVALKWLHHLKSRRAVRSWNWTQLDKDSEPRERDKKQHKLLFFFFYINYRFNYKRKTQGRGAMKPIPQGSRGSMSFSLSHQSARIVGDSVKKDVPISNPHATSLC